MCSMLDLLLIDDNPADAQLVREALSQDATVVHMNHDDDGEAALSRLERTVPNALPHVVLLDWNLPRCSGADVLSRMKRDPALKLIPVIVFSSSRYPRDVALAYELGASCYLVKPLDLSAFMQLVKLIEAFWSLAVTRVTR